MALYLKYRPLTFSDLTGQEFIKKTLKTAISEDKTVGAYIFTWPRGTGKTSTARIFAKAINCENPIDGDPCGVCETCVAFGNNSLIDIIEIDAASHTWVDNIREIIEKAQFQPTHTKYKIYIIDEVHMLSKWAFNALLKILEEPPAHIKFILATTDIHKVPDTILSRCQRYDFKNFSEADIKERLSYIASKEGIVVDEASYHYVAESSEWAMRNAVSLFEQLIVGWTISYEYIKETLWILSKQEQQEFLQKLLHKDISALSDFEWYKNEGKNLKNFIKTIIQLLQTDSIEELKKWNDISRNIDMLDILHTWLQQSKHSFDESLTLKIALLKILNTVDYLWERHEEKVAWKIPLVVTQIDKQAETKNTPEITQSKENLVEAAKDIFWNNQEVNNAKISSPKSHISSGSWFDIEGLIVEMKKKWAKAAASMSLRGSHVSLEWDVLSVQTKTQIAEQTLKKTDNQEFIFQAATEMWIPLSRIQILN